MHLGDLIKLDAVIPSVKAANKKALIAELAERAGELLEVEDRPIYEALWQRESLSSTGIGRGIAIPHARVAQVRQMFGMFAKLDRPIEFESMDNEPVDLVFLLLAPESAGADHLKALARVSRLMRDPLTLDRLRSTKAKAAIHALLTESVVPSAA
jgi:nitrogen PTS system EIIA component